MRVRIWRHDCNLQDGEGTGRAAGWMLPWIYLSSPLPNISVCDRIRCPEAHRIQAET